MKRQRLTQGLCCRNLLGRNVDTAVHEVLGSLEADSRASKPTNRDGIDDLLYKRQEVVRIVLAPVWSSHQDS